MSLWVLNTAVAVEFDWTSAGAGADGSITVGSGTVSITVPSVSNARMHLGASPASPLTDSGPGTDFVRYVQEAINASLGILTERVTLVLGEDGRITASVDSGVMTLSLSLGLNRILGFISASGVASATADEPPMYLGLLAGSYGGVWERKEPGLAIDEDSGGNVYSFDGGSAQYRREVTCPLVPATLAYAVEAEYPGTPVRPDLEHWSAIASTATARRWSWWDIVKAARNRIVAVALGNFQETRTSDAERFFVGQLTKETQQDLRATRQDDSGQRDESITLGVVCRGDAPASTRA